MLAHEPILRKPVLDGSSCRNRNASVKGFVRQKIDTTCGHLLRAVDVNQKTIDVILNNFGNATVRNRKFLSFRSRLTRCSEAYSGASPFSHK